jgi:hypothetical protein
MTRVYQRVVLAFLFLIGASAHVGSPNAYFSGKAGPYVIDVVVRPPSVVPGVAEVIVRSNDKRVAGVSLRPVYWRAGAKGAPSGDEAKPVDQQPGVFTGNLWMMATGAYSVEVTVRGSAGTGVASVPAVAVATGQLGLSPLLRTLLIILGTLLVAGIITAVHVAGGESQVAPGEAMSPKRRRIARRSALIAVPVVAFLLLGGANWWNSEAEAYTRTLYRPLQTSAQVHLVDSVPMLDVVVTDKTWRTGVTPLMPDHGKMAHMFVVGTQFPFAFAHLHPTMPDRYTFRATLPPMPPGSYRIFTDVVHESGFQRTLVDSVKLLDWSNGAGLKRLDADESWSLNERVFVSSYMENKGHDGNFFIRYAGTFPVYAEKTGVLHFSLADVHGDPPVVEPYLGMPGHAVVVREDGKVFTHLHPSGTSSMAALTAFDLRNRGDTMSNGRLNLSAMPEMSMMTRPDTVRYLDFPYAFPSAGRFRVYVQARVNGEVHTTAFDMEVRPMQLTTERR